MNHRLVFLWIVGICILSPLGWSASSWTMSNDYGDRAANKLGFGLRNALWGWSEIFTETVDSIRDEGNPIEGLFIGIFRFTGRTVGGVLHAATFPLTSFDIPLPEQGGSLWPYAD